MSNNIFTKDEEIKLKNRQLEEKSDLELAMDLFGTGTSTNIKDSTNSNEILPNKKIDKKFNKKFNKKNDKKKLSSSDNFDKFDAIALEYYDKFN